MTRSHVLCHMLAIFLITLSGCCNSKKDATTASGITAAKSPLVPDSPEGRFQQATRYIQAYPVQEWGDDILSRVTSQTGSEVSAEVRKKIYSRVTEKVLVARRIELLIQTYTAPELQVLADLASTPEGKTVIRKLPLIDDKTRERIAPVIAAVLSGTE
jgi:hypothetical protein